MPRRREVVTLEAAALDTVGTRVARVAGRAAAWAGGRS